VSVSDLTGSARRVADALAALGVAAEVRVMPDSTRTADEAAAAIGCGVGQIVKSLVFRAVEADEPVLVLVSGADRVDEQRLADALGGPVERATGRFVRERTGFAIGGVSPVGYESPILILLDRGLMEHDVVWAAAGSPHAVFPISPPDLILATAPRVVSVTKKG
jgi:prolyl-tRNA editing enzyme YbaK/EbsC (Cys-tRNA(Pro) deacylase)